MHRGKWYYRLWKTADFSVEKLWKRFLFSGNLFIEFFIKKKGPASYRPFLRV